MASVKHICTSFFHYINVDDEQTCFFFDVMVGALNNWAKPCLGTFPSNWSIIALA